MILDDSYKQSGIAYDKVLTPEETILKVRKRLAETDIHILKDTVRIDKGRLGIPVYISKYHHSAAKLTGTYKQMGKGATASQAEASAIMELVERFSLFDFVKNRRRPELLMNDIEQPVIPACDLVKALHPTLPDNCMEQNLSRLLDTLPMEWIRAVAPADGSEVMLPLSWFWPINEYNGSASGNSHEEAAVQALSEVIERHVCSLVTYDRLVTPEIDQSSVIDSIALDLMQKFNEAGVNLILKDFSLDTGVPTVAAIAWDPSTYPERSEIVYTAGTAPAPERALVRALTEVAQLAGDFDTDGRYVESGLPKFQGFSDAAYVMDCSRTVSIKDMPDCSSNNFRTELELMSKNIEKTGMKVYIADVTHPTLDLPVVYAMVAGNHFRNRTINLDLPFHVSRIASECMDSKAALQTLELLEEFYPKRYDIAFFKARIHEKNGDYGQATELYNESLNREPAEGELASIYCHIGICLREMDKHEDAISALDKAKELNADLKEIHNQLGYCYYRQGQYLKAIEAFEAAISIDPGSAIDYANIASNLRKLGMKAEAIDFYNIALELDPSIEWAKNHKEELLE